MNIKNHKLTFVTFACIALLQACGSGNDAASTNAAANSGASGSTALKQVVYQGPVTGFGSVIVNGVRFAENAATVQDEDGTTVSRSALHLGSIIQVKGTSADAATTGTATTLTVLPSARGRVEAVDAVAGTLTIMGVKVTIDSATVFEGSSGLTAIVAGDLVEVHGTANATGILATLIEKRAAVSNFAVHGVIGTINTAAKTFTVGNLTVQYASAVLVPATTVLAAGQSVFIGSPAAPVAGVLSAAKIRVRDGAGRGATADSVVSVRGVVETLPDANGKLKISGNNVDTKTATFDGANTFTLGARVTVRGQWLNDVLVATKVNIEPARATAPRNELFGVIASIATGGTSFSINGVTVDASTATFTGGSAATLANGVYAEVRGDVTSTTAGSVVKATSVKIRPSAEIASQGDDDRSGAGQREVYGAVHDFTSLSNFKVGTMTVNASTARVDQGVGADIKNGAFVEIRASLVNGVLVATAVEIQQSRSVSDSAPRR
jgi:Domain of unknown function (DUF5666)